MRGKRYLTKRLIKTKRVKPPKKTQKLKKVLTKNPIIIFLSGCFGFAQPAQMIKKTKKKKEVPINKIFIPTSKIVIFVNSY